MAGFLLCATRVLFLFYISFILVSCDPANKPIRSVPEPLIQSALHSLNEDSPTHHTYKGGNLINAQRLEESPYVVYRLTFDLTPICKEALEPCPREACTIEVKQHEQGDITVLRESIQCTYLYPQPLQDDPLQMQENSQEQETTENLDKQIVSSQSVELNHEIQKTGDNNEKPFIAMRASNPKYCPGCPYELNPNLPGLVVFGEQVAKSMDELIQNDFKHKVVDIVKVTRAVPPSSNIVQYQILLHIGESDCLKNAIDQSQCQVQVNLPIKTCLVTFEEQPWEQSGRKITKNNCTQENNIEVRDTYLTLNAEALVTSNPNKEEGNNEKTEALENLKHILDNYAYVTTTKPEEQEQPEVTEHPTVKVSVNRDTDNVTPQRFEDKTKEFNEFLKGFDVSIKEVKSNSEINREEVKEGIIFPKKVSSENSAINESHSIYRNKRSNFVGAPSSKNINDPEIRELANKGLQEFSKNFQSTNEPIIVEIVEASRQVVSGYLYKINVKLGTSTCPKGTRSNCQLQEGSKIQQCLFTIWSQPWKNEESPTINFDCDLQPKSDAFTSKDRLVPEVRKKVLEETEKVFANSVSKESPNSLHRYKRNLVGAPTSKNVNDPEIQQLANKGLQRFSENSEGTNEPIIAEIVEASQQVVSGTLYKIKVKLGTSTCPKGVKNNCQLKEGSEMKECLFTIWSQPWIDKGNPEITINCDVNNRRKRSLKGVRYSQKMLNIAEDMKVETLFNNFMEDYDKTYSSPEEKQKRFKIFKSNLKIIEDLQKYELGTAEYGATIFADLTPKEFKAHYLGLRRELEHDNEIPLLKAEVPDVDLPPRFDWRDHGAVTPVKDQGQCGSCWAFSVTGNVEGQYAIKHGKLLSLSEQELVDCDTLDEGCSGGDMKNAYKSIETLGGLELESDYPYDAKNEKCHFDQTEAKVQVSTAMDISSNETQMAQWLVQNGPISVGINANAMQFYMGGVSHPLRIFCDPKNLDHGVLIVGYGTSKYPLFHKLLPYWIIKNSWGRRWGEQGYYRVYRGDGTCGINTMATSAIVI